MVNFSRNIQKNQRDDLKVNEWRGN